MDSNIQWFTLFINQDIWQIIRLVKVNSHFLKWKFGRRPHMASISDENFIWKFSQDQSPIHPNSLPIFPTVYMVLDVLTTMLFSYHHPFLYVYFTTWWHYSCLLWPAYPFFLICSWHMFISCWSKSATSPVSLLSVMRSSHTMHPRIVTRANYHVSISMFIVLCTNTPLLTV